MRPVPNQAEAKHRHTMKSKKPKKIKKQKVITELELI